MSGVSRLAGNDGCVGSFARLRKLFVEEHLDEALRGADPSYKLAIPVSTNTLYNLLQRCIEKKDLLIGRKVQHLIMRSGFESNTFLGSHLIRMFAVCGSVSEANNAFSKLSEPNAFTWSTIIQANTKLGQGEHAIKLYHQMRQLRVKPGEYIFVAVLKACASIASLEEGKLIHAHVIESGCELNSFIWNSLIDMYAKCGSLEQARRVFDRLASRDVVTWSAMISGYTLHGDGYEALQVFYQMQEQGVEPNDVTFVCILKGCCAVGVPHEGKLIHALILRRGMESSIPVGTSLIDMYVKLGSLQDAFQVFDKLPRKGLVAWTTMIAGYGQNGNGMKALQLFHQMQEKGMEPNSVTFVCLLKACSSIPALDQGKLIHTCIIEGGYESHAFVGSTLIDMYAKCGSLKDARNVFDKLLKRSAVTWNVMITGYAQDVQEGQEALLLYQKMQQEGLQPYNVTYCSLLKACCNIAALDHGKLVHAQVSRSACESNLIVGNALITMYVKCGSLKDARKVFDQSPKRDIVTWTEMIGGYAQHEHGQEALQLFHQMHLDGWEPDNVLFVSILQACSSIDSLYHGQLIHSQIIERDCELDIYVGSTLMDMYAKCGSLEDARKLFDKLPKQCTVTWSVMIAGYVMHELGQNALILLQEMQLEGLELDSVTLVSILKACSTVAALNQGLWIHAHIIETGFVLNLYAATTLIDMYAKCGSLEDACRLFDKLEVRNVVTWNVIICGCVQHGDCQMALQYFEEMKQGGLKPTEATINCLLSALKHEGLVHETSVLFKEMQTSMLLREDHYHCMVNLLGHGGHLSEAEDILNSSPCQGNKMGWVSLLNHCRYHGNVEAGIQCFHHVLSRDHMHAAGYMLMSCIYSDAGMLEQAKCIQALKACAYAWKKPGRAFIEIQNKVHDFTVGDVTHPVMGGIHAMMMKLNVEMKAGGYVPMWDI